MTNYDISLAAGNERNDLCNFELLQHSKMFITVERINFFPCAPVGLIRNNVLFIIKLILNHFWDS